MIQLPGLGTWWLRILRETSWMYAAGQHWRCGDRHSGPFFFSKVTEKQLYEARLARNYLLRNKLTGRERLLIFHFSRDQGQEWAYWKEFCSFLRNTKPHLFCNSCDGDWGTAHPAKPTGVAAVHWLCVGLSTYEVLSRQAVHTESPESPAHRKGPSLLPSDHPGVYSFGCWCSRLSGGKREAARVWPPVELGEGEQRIFWPGSRAVGFTIILGPVSTSSGFFILRP